VGNVFEEVRAAEAALSRAVKALDPGCLDVKGAKKLVDLFTRCERLAVAGRGRAARRVEDAVNWKKDGHRSAADWFANATGTSVGAASRSLGTARKLEQLPETQEAFSSGELSEAQAAEIAQAASLDPSAERRLLERARRGGSFRRLRDECRDAAVRARDDRKHAQYLHESRAVNIWTDAFDGAFRIDGRLAPDEGAFVKSALENKTNEIFEAARQAGRCESRAAYMADALVALLRGEAPVKEPEVRLEGDVAAIERGYVEPGERMELVGIGPIPVTIARGLLNDARVSILSREGTEITRITSPKRTIPAALRRWLERAYPMCGHLGCGSRERLQIDHVIPIEEHGPTERGNLWRLCSYHHKLKTFYGWRAVGPEGERRLVPPDDQEERGPP
jgi:Domain of unknown function (DUF222)/HNH endonuclease